MMSYSSLLIVMLALGASLLSISSAQTCAPACMNCKTKGKCGTTTPPALEANGECGANEACILLGKVPSCRPIAETNCTCGGKMKGCDPYDKSQPVFCVSGQVYKAVQCTAPKDTCFAGACFAGADVPVTPTPATECTDPAKNEYKLVKPGCRAGVFCAGTTAVTVTQCKDTEYFDLSNLACQPFPPPNPCGCGNDRCPLISSCSKYAVCSGDTILDNEETCTGTNTDKFHFGNQACGAAADGACQPYETCTFVTTPTTTISSSTSTISATASSTPSSTTSSTASSTSSSTTSSTASSTPSSTTSTTVTTPTTPGSTTTTSTRPSTCNAANANRRYPHATDCKKYYTCRLITGSSYGYVAATCIGALVFNPASSYCDLRDNVPACKQ